MNKKNNMHIGFLIMNFSNGGGTERVTSIIANNLSKRGYQITIISCQHGDKNIFPIDNSLNNLSLHGENYDNKLIRKLKTFRELYKIVRQQKIDIMIAVDVSLYLYLWPIQILGLCKCIAWEHFNYNIKRSRIDHFSKNFAARNANCIVVLGKNDLNNYKTHISKIKRIEYIYNPITLNLDTVSNLKSKRILAAGRLSPQKGFDLLIDIWKLIENQITDWHLDIIGNGSMKYILQNKIDEYHLQNIHLCEFTKDIEKEYINSSIFVFPSRYEGFGLVLMEAQAKGLPCISFNCKEGPAEIIDDNVNGYLIEEGNIQQFAEKLLLLINDENLRLQFSKKAQKDLYRFETNKIIAQWERLLNSL